jgi:hypothetical protein
VRGSDSTIYSGRGGELRIVSTNRERQVWETPVLTYEGNVDELVLAIPGKSSVTPGDTQETRKALGG